MSEAERVGAAAGMVDAYLGLYAGHLLVIHATIDDRKAAVARRHIGKSLANAHAAVQAIRLGVHRSTAHPDEICGTD